MQQSKRFYLFVQKPPSAQDSVPLRVLQECVPLQSHVNVVYVTAENAQSLPPAVKSNGLPSLYDSNSGSCSKDAGAVMQAMARRAQATLAAASPRGSIGVSQVPVPSRGPPAPSSMDITKRRGNLELGEGFSKAEAQHATSLLESRSAVGGFGTAGSSFMGMGNAMRASSLLNEDGGWQKATLDVPEVSASRLLADSFGSTGGAAVVPPTATTNPQSYRAAKAGERSEKVDMDSEEFKAMLESRHAAEVAFKQQQKAMPPAAHTMGMQAQSRQERLKGAEGMQLLRPLVKPAAGAADSIAHIPF